MLGIRKTFDVLRNNWKKSVLGAVIVTYGGHVAKERYECNMLMRNYCHEAMKFGLLLEDDDAVRKVIVLLNPAADKRKAKKNFDKFCAPLLHLAGIQVDVVTTKFVGEACSLAENFDESVGAVVVAGGNGTLAEVVTGLLRRCDGENPLRKQIPIGVLPLGQTNSLAKSLFKCSSEDNVATMAKATMAIIRATKKPLDVIKIEQLEQEEGHRPVYSIGGLEWGALYDAYAKRDKYWYWGALRSYMTYIFIGLKQEGKDVTWNCAADLAYSMPCAGCSHCYRDHEPMRQRKSPTRWWNAFIPRNALGRQNIAPKVDYSKIENAACTEEKSMKISNVGIALKTCHGECDHGDVPHMEMLVGPSNIDYFDFISKGWKFIRKGDPNYVTKMLVKDVKLHPERYTETKDMQWFYIDNDNYEVRPIHLKLLPKKILVFCH